MPEELELSLMNDTAAPIQPLLDQFEAEHGVHVRVRLLPWDAGWNTLFQSALQGRGSDVSEIGSTWLGDLAGMNALQPFSAEAVAELGGAEAFMPVAWRSCHMAGQPQTWAIPWLVGARLLFYRRDLLARHGIDPQTAFSTADRLDRTLGQLQAAGVSVPWTVPTGSTHTTLLNVASWIWGAGGAFVTPDGKRTVINQTAARAGLRAYFALGRYLAPSVRRLSGTQPDMVFLQNPDAAVTISGSWLFQMARDQGTPGLPEQLGAALPPGPSFVGGSHLVIWKHSQNYDAAVQLVRFLTGTPAIVDYSRAMGLLPARVEALDAEPFAGDPLWQQTREGVRTGRSFPVIRSWGMIEYRLVAALSSLWAETLASPGQDVDAVLRKHLDPLAQRLDQLLGQS
ncbi:MAG TPA: extracellular solute-binding protein [Chloroflexia bacterium]|jgi:multiple sugar transport system substrate-binding protein|nr:extracellular solute-binding protein [Chloroflexia bacterium]